MTRTRFRRAIAAVVIATLVWASPTRADKIVLRGGGQIKGKILPADPKRPSRVTVLTERGKTPLTFEKTQIAEIIPETGPLDGYLSRREKASATDAKAQYDLGVYCEENKLADLARMHYEAALKADDGFAPAHEKLHHVLHGDRWLTGDEIKEAQGLVKYKGKWVTVGVRDQKEKQVATTAEQASWVRRLKLLREALLSGIDDRRREADAQLMSINEPIAIGPLIKVFGSDPPPVRSMLARFVGAIDGPEASAALVSKFLNEDEPEVRLSFVDEILRRADAEVTKRLVTGLRSDAPDIVNRAAWALAKLNAVKTVPSLINVLVQTKTVIEAIDGGGQPGAMGGSSVNPGGLPPPGLGRGAGRTGAAPGGMNGMVPYPTYAAAGPGGVAALVPSVGSYSTGAALDNSGIAGLSSSGSGMIGSGSGLSNGAGAPGLGSGRMPSMVFYTIQNGEVLAALIKMTGQDFGYDVDAWKRWLRTSFRPDSAPARHVPQP